MLDIQKERIRRRIVASIAEIWRKETGSIVPLTVEGTVCITPQYGRTTAIQFSENVVGGTLPEHDFDCEGQPMFEIPIKRKRYGEYSWATEWDTDSRRGNKNVFSRDDNNNHSSVIDAEIQQSDETTVKNEEPCDDEDDSLDERYDYEMLQSSEIELSSDNIEINAQAGPVCPGTGYYKCRTQTVTNSEGYDNEKLNTKVENNDSGVQDISNIETEGTCLDHEDKNLPASQSEDSDPTSKTNDQENSQSTVSITAIDLSRRESDLIISSPLTYTTQVHEAIRNKLSNKLATVNGKASDGNSTPNSKTCHRTLVTTGNGQRVELILPKGIAAGNNTIVRMEKCIGISPTGARSIPKHSTPISLMCATVGKQILEKSLQSLLNRVKPSPSVIGNSSLDSSSVEQKPNITLPVLPLPTAVNSIKTEINSEPASNSLEQKSYNCSHCHKTFLFKSKYLEHLPVHRTDRPFKCDTCHRTYKYKYDLRVHLRTHLGIPTKSTICPFCNMKFPTNKLLRQHISDDHKDQQEVTKAKLLQPNDESSIISTSVSQEIEQDPNNLPPVSKVEASV